MLRKILLSFLLLTLLFGCAPLKEAQDEEPQIVDESAEFAQALDSALVARSMPVANQPPALIEDAVRIPETDQVPISLDGVGRSADTLIADIAIEADYELYQKFGSEAATRNYIIQLISDISAIYERDVNVRLNPSFIRIATSPNDPWSSSSTSGALHELRNYWNTNETNRQRAVVLLLSGRNLGGGIAYLGSACYANYQANNSYDYAVAANLNGTYDTSPSSNTWDIVVVAHELGHSFNSEHAHCYRRSNNEWYSKCYNQEDSCYSGNVVASNGTIMSYCHLNGGDQKINPLAFTDGDPAMTNVLRQFAESRSDQNTYGCLRIDGDPQPTPTSEPPPTATPTSNGTIFIEQVWTADANANVKTTFNPNDVILYYAEVVNSSNTSQSAYFEWSATGPCGFSDGWDGTLTISSGSSNWYLDSTIPSNACSGVYDYEVSVISDGQTYSADTTFIVGSNATSTPPPTNTPPPPTNTPPAPTNTPPPTATPDPGTNTLVSLSPSSQTVSVNSEACVDVTIAGAPQTGGFQFDLSFPPSLLQITNITEGAFLGSTGRNTIPVDNIDNANGVATYGGASFGNQPGASGSGMLATVCFEAQSDGVATLGLSNSQLTNVAGGNINHNTQGGSITISNCYWADMDCDGDVDIVDIQLVASRWNTSTNNGNYDARYDLDNDGDIDIVDIQRIAAQWNWQAGRSEAASSPPNIPGSNVSRGSLTLSLDSNELDLQIGDTVTVGLDVTDAMALAAFQTTLSYNPEHLRVNSVSLTSYLASTGRTIVPLDPDINHLIGKVSFGAVSFGTQPAIDGSGTLALVEITAIGNGSDAIDVNSSIATEPNGNEHTISEQDGMINVSSTPTNVSMGRSGTTNVPYGVVVLIALMSITLVSFVWLRRIV